MNQIFTYLAFIHLPRLLLFFSVITSVIIHVYGLWDMYILPFMCYWIIGCSLHLHLGLNLTGLSSHLHLGLNPTGLSSHLHLGLNLTGLSSHLHLGLNLTGLSSHLHLHNLYIKPSYKQSRTVVCLEPVVYIRLAEMLLQAEHWLLLVGVS